MNLTKDQKKQRSAKLADEFKGASSIFFASYQGLKFQDLAGLREKLVPAQCKFTVTRNSIVNHALKGAGMPASPNAAIAKGPTAIAIQETGDIVEVARVLVAFEKGNPALKLKGCYSSSTWFTTDECKRLATLGTKTEMVSQLLGALQGNLTAAAGVLQAPIRDFAYVLKAVEEKKKAGATAA